MINWSQGAPLIGFKLYNYRDDIKKMKFDSETIPNYYVIFSKNKELHK